MERNFGIEEDLFERVGSESTVGMDCARWTYIWKDTVEESYMIVFIVSYGLIRYLDDDDFPQFFFFINLEKL